MGTIWKWILRCWRAVFGTTAVPFLEPPLRPADVRVLRAYYGLSLRAFGRLCRPPARSKLVSDWEHDGRTAVYMKQMPAR